MLKTFHILKQNRLENSQTPPWKPLETTAMGSHSDFPSYTATKALAVSSSELGTVYLNEWQL